MYIVHVHTFKPSLIVVVVINQRKSSNGEKCIHVEIIYAIFCPLFVFKYYLFHLEKEPIIFDLTLYFLLCMFDISGISSPRCLQPKYHAWDYENLFTSPQIFNVYRRGQINLIWLKDDYSGMSEVLRLR